MIRHKRARARYQTALRQAIVDNQDAVFQALMHTNHDRLDSKLALFLLEEAAWPIESFMQAYLEVNLHA